MQVALDRMLLYKDLQQAAVKRYRELVHAIRVWGSHLMNCRDAAATQSLRIHDSGRCKTSTLHQTPKHGDVCKPTRTLLGEVKLWLFDTLLLHLANQASHLTSIPEHYGHQAPTFGSHAEACCPEVGCHRFSSQGKSAVNHDVPTLRDIFGDSSIAFAERAPSPHPEPSLDDHWGFLTLPRELRDEIYDLVNEADREKYPNVPEQRLASQLQNLSALPIASLPPGLPPDTHGVHAHMALGSPYRD